MKRRSGTSSRRSRGCGGLLPPDGGLFDASTGAGGWTAVAVADAAGRCAKAAASLALLSLSSARASSLRSSALRASTSCRRNSASRRCCSSARAAASSAASLSANSRSSRFLAASSSWSRRIFARTLIVVGCLLHVPSRSAETVWASETMLWRSSCSASTHCCICFLISRMCLRAEYTSRFGSV